MSTSASFSKYGKPFQETLAHLILEDRPFAGQMKEVLDINFFELKYLRVFLLYLGAFLVDKRLPAIFHEKFSGIIHFRFI